LAPPNWFGASAERIIAVAARLLDDPAEYARMTNAGNPFGDGQAARRIADTLIVRHSGDAGLTALDSDEQRGSPMRR